eukprot:TRINITY_DN22749_c0_g1_i1.p1 TRINITY_DN22749_c0_g1~~TRINITY_DN22749_c0_g1_i1.p1  ORF type:complete len:120 (+),score=9.79 TRINITY_DN22749_c0_g1_i1:56-361(+)
MESLGYEGFGKLITFINLACAFMFVILQGLSTADIIRSSFMADNMVFGVMIIVNLRAMFKDAELFSDWNLKTGYIVLFWILYALLYCGIFIILFVTNEVLD